MHFAADHNRRVKVAVLNDVPNHRGGGRFAVCAGYAYAVFHMHQLSQHFGALYNGNAFFKGGAGFNIFISFNGAGIYHHISSLDILGLMTDGDISAQLPQPIDGLARAGIRSGDGIALLKQDFGHPAHTNPSNTHHVNVAGSSKNGLCLNLSAHEWFISALSMLKFSLLSFGLHRDALTLMLPSASFLVSADPLLVFQPVQS